jgi:hypothetical protein
MHVIKIHPDNHSVTPEIIKRLTSIGLEVSLTSFSNIVIHDPDVSEDELSAINDVISVVIEQWEKEKEMFMNTIAY